MKSSFLRLLPLCAASLALACRASDLEAVSQTSRTSNTSAVTAASPMKDEPARQEPPDPQGPREHPAATLTGLARVDAEAKRWLASRELDGGALLVLRDGKIAPEAFYGSYDAMTVVPIASATKWLSGALLMTLVDRGELDLDASVSKYLPEFTGDKSAITVRMLFNHTSGIPSEDRARGGPLNTLEKAAASIANLELEFAPGSRFHYGSNGMQVGGRIAEVCGKKGWNELFEERIAKPLGLANTSYGVLGRTRNPLIAGGGRSSLRDYGAFLQMLLDGGKVGETQVLTEASVDELLRDRTGDAHADDTLLGRRVRAVGYGVGCWVERKDADGQTIAASSPGAFGFTPWIDRANRVAGVWMIDDKELAGRAGSGRLDIVPLVNEALGIDTGSAGAKR